MRITNAISLEQFVEKIERKQGVRRDEVESLFAAHHGGTENIENDTEKI